MKSIAADVTIKDNYLDFINKATIEYNSNKKTYDRIIAAKQSIYEELLPCKESIAINLHIDLNIYKEFTTKEFNESFALYNRVNKLYKDGVLPEHRPLVITLLKWCSVLNKEREVLEHLYIATKKVTMKYVDYREYVFNYYSAVHRKLLEGKGYHFQNGVGILYVERSPIVAGGRKIDFAATRKRKEELINQGKKIYNKTEADICDTLGYEYDGEDYRVFMNKDACIRLKFINSKYWNNSYYDFKPIHYIHAKYRGTTYQELLKNNCKSIEDIYSLRVDLRTKIALLLMMDNTKYINFDRKVV